MYIEPFVNIKLHNILFKRRMNLFPDLSLDLVYVLELHINILFKKPYYLTWK